MPVDDVVGDRQPVPVQNGSGDSRAGQLEVVDCFGHLVAFPTGDLVEDGLHQAGDADDVC